MKRIVKLLLVILIVFLVLQVIIFLFKGDHTINYEIVDKDNIYKINEIYKNGVYHIGVSYKDVNFSFLVLNNHFKKKHIISSVKSYVLDDLVCLYLPDTDNNMVCNKNGNMISYELIKDSVSSFIELLQKEGYDNDVWNESDSSVRRLGNMSVYLDNLLDDHYLYVYQYRGFNTISVDDFSKIELFKNDVYINDLGVVVDKYYVVPDYEQKYDFDKFYVINMTNNKVKEIKFDFNISKNSYINGIYNNELYLFDRDSVKQYVINPKKRSIREIANKNNKALIYEMGKEVYYDVYDLKKKDIYFKDNAYLLNEIVKNTDFKYLKEFNDCYFYVVSDSMYVYDSLLDSKKLLFKSSDINNISVVSGSVYFLSGSNLYRYYFGNVQKIVNYEEFSFNKTNRVAIYVR